MLMALVNVHQAIPAQRAELVSPLITNSTFTDPSCTVCMSEQTSNVSATLYWHTIKPCYLQQALQKLQLQKLLYISWPCWSPATILLNYVRFHLFISYQKTKNRIIFQTRKVKSKLNPISFMYSWRTTPFQYNTKHAMKSTQPPTHQPLSFDEASMKSFCFVL